MPQLSSGKDKLVEVRVARICPTVAGALLASLQGGEKD